uniref:hypothetical protein n=1 Tax=Clostridium sp. NkU-1 TaxID=1095009 RepID=UPI000AA8CBE7
MGTLIPAAVLSTTIMPNPVVDGLLILADIITSGAEPRTVRLTLGATENVLPYVTKTPPSPAGIVAVPAIKLLFTLLNKLVNQSLMGLFLLPGNRQKGIIYEQRKKMILNDGTAISLETGASLLSLLRFSKTGRLQLPLCQS